MTNEDYILQHLDDDTRSLALKKAPDGIDMSWCLQQIEGHKLAKKKLPRWAESLSTNGGELLWFPPRLSMEQCSSELTAQYKRSVLERQMNELGIKAEDSSFTDLTGGFGIDFSYMAQGFKHATYVERMPHLCDIAHHNFPLLGLDHAEIINGDAGSIIDRSSRKSIETIEASTVFFLDPARRDDVGRKVFALEDCTPNLIELQDELLCHADLVMVKLSPMLDITQALRSVKGVCEVHVVSVQGECKEVLLVMKPNNDIGVTYHCVNLGTDEDVVRCTEKERCMPPTLCSPTGATGVFTDTTECGIDPTKGREFLLSTVGREGGLLFEPNASILKAGVQDVLCQRYGLQKLHPISNLYIAPPPRVGGEGVFGKGVVFPGRTFIIEDVGDFSKAGIKRVLSGLKQANLTIRNFPGTVADLRKRFKLKEGGDVYIFVTTLADGSHAILRCKRPPTP